MYFLGFYVVWFHFFLLFVAIDNLYPDGSPIPLFTSGSGDNNLKRATHLDDVISRAPVTTPAANETVGFHNDLLYCFTSGTTGFPKAAIITHSR